MDWKNYKPEVQEDLEDFPKLNGRYKGKIESCIRREGVNKDSGNPYDFYGMKIRVLDTVSGDKGNNRILDITFNNDEDGLKRLANSYFTAGLDCDVSPEGIDATIAKNIDKEVNIRAWIYDDRQWVKVVKEFKVKGDGKKEPAF